MVPAVRPVARHAYTLSQSKKGTASEPAVPMLTNFATPSPDELRTDLPNPRIARTRNVAEGGAANVPGGIAKLRMIEDVEEFTPNLEVHCFIEWNHLRYAQIGIVDSRAMEESPVRRPESSAIGARSGPREIAVGRDKCALVEICVVSASTRVVDVNRSCDIGHIGGGAASKRAVSLARYRGG